MAITLDLSPSSSITLQELIEVVDKSYKDLSRDNLLEIAPYLHMLSYNRSFLSDYIISELKDIYDFQPKNNYTAQTLMLGGVAQKFYVRANVWLPEKLIHPINSEGEKQLYSFERAHDHNFEFITVGYLGDGYETEIYEYKGGCKGEPGEAVELDFLERTSLPEHKLMLYRASTDVHIQKIPKRDFSVSINILAPPISGREQYQFDLDQGSISRLLRADSLGQKWLIEAAGHLCDGNITEVLFDIARHHPSGKTRTAARTALSTQSPDLLSILDDP